MSEAKPRKQGRLGKDDIEFIRANHATMPVSEIAAKLRRTEESVREAIRLHCQIGNAAEIKKDLLSSEAWARLKEEFTQEELRFFQEQYLEIKGQFQFKGEVLATEDTQIVQVIKLQILMHRNLVSRKQCLDDNKRISNQIQDTLAEHGGEVLDVPDDKRHELNLWQNHLEACRESEKELSIEYNRMQERCDKLLFHLKGTRDQRLKKIESTKIDYMSVVKDLQIKEIQEKEGRSLELAKMASKRELERLGAPHKYVDGVEDRPVLNSETVGMLECEKP